VLEAGVLLHGDVYGLHVVPDADLLGPGVVLVHQCKVVFHLPQDVLTSVDTLDQFSLGLHDFEQLLLHLLPHLQLLKHCAQLTVRCGPEVGEGDVQEHVGVPAFKPAVYSYGFVSYRRIGDNDAAPGARDLTPLSFSFLGVLLEEERDWIYFLLLEGAGTGRVNEPEPCSEFLLSGLDPVVDTADGGLFTAVEVLDLLEDFHRHVACLLVGQEACMHGGQTQWRVLGLPVAVVAKQFLGKVLGLLKAVFGTGHTLFGALGVL